MKRTKEILACIVALVILVFAVNDVSATSGGNVDWNSLLPSNNTTNTTNTNNTVNTPTNTNDNYQQIVVTNNTNNAVNVANTTNNTNTAVPYTGINNTSILVIIGICGISAIYAYKKIRDYNIK